MFSISARWSSSTPFGQTGRAARVHEDDGIVLVGLLGDDRPPGADELFVAESWGTSPSPISTTCSIPASSPHRVDERRERSVGEAHLRLGVARG